MIAAEMSAFVVETGGGGMLRRVPVPRPGPGEVLIRVAACGVCHSDLHIADGDWPLLQSPVIPGHEIVGRIVEVGPGVSSELVGRTAGVAWLGLACGTCSCCARGMESICPDKAMTGYSRNGGFADYVIATADFILPLDDVPDPAALAPVLCAGLTSYRAVKRCMAQPGDTLAVVGAGGLGHMAVQYARAMGYRAIAVDLSAAKLDLCCRLGAVAGVLAGRPETVEEVRAATGSEGADAVLVTAPSHRACADAVAMLRPGGTCVIVGLPADGDVLPVSIAGLSGRELTLRGSNVGTRVDLAEAVSYALRGEVACAVETMPLARAAEALDRLRRGTVEGRLVLTVEAS